MKIKVLLVSLLFVFLLTSCSIKQDISQADSIVENITEKPNKLESTYIEWALNMASTSGDYHYKLQIPKFKIDSYVAKCINAEIESRFLTLAEEYLAKPDFELYIETEYYISDEVISIKIIQQDLPNYGTDGEIYTVNYSIKHDTVLPFSYAVKEKNTNYQALQDEIYKAYSDRYYEYMDASIFYINKDGEIVIVVIALEHPQECETWKHIYHYVGMNN